MVGTREGGGVVGSSFTNVSSRGSCLIGGGGGGVSGSCLTCGNDGGSCLTCGNDDDGSCLICGSGAAAKASGDISVISLVAGVLDTGLL